MNDVRVVGVDISKSTFDAQWQDDGLCSAEFSNDDAGFDQFFGRLPCGAHVVMEATGTYFLKLATYLHRLDVDVSVVNPAKPAYFARMKLMRTKSDPVDAGILRRFGEYETLPLWQPVEDIFIELNQLDRHLQGLLGDLNRVNNRLEALNQCVTRNEFTWSDLEAQKVDLEGRIGECEKVLEQLATQHYPELFRRLTSIRGIGPKTAVMFIVLTQGFTRFPDARKFIAFLGTSSFTRTSGTSVRGSGAISKMGNARMRQLLYMGALTARRQNKACRIFAERLSANGKPPKVVRIAVANKLIRQAFAVLTKEESYSENYA